MFSSIGSVVGFLAYQWDTQSTVSNFFISPINFLSGTFFSITSLPENGELSDILRSIGSVEYYPNANFFGLDSFAYRVSDGELYSQESLVTIEVLPINDPPFLVGEWFSIDEDTETILPLNLGDPDDDDIIPLLNFVIFIN